MHFLALLALAAPLAVSAAVHQVVVGSSSGQTIFTPEAIAANPGDIVTFQFQQKNHSVVQSSFANPCGPAPGGFNSGYMPVAPDVTSDFPEYNITVQDSAPIWVYCSQKNPVPHCGLGMVFAVNCGPSGAPNSFDNFKAAALAQGAAFASSASAAGAASTAVGYGGGAAPPSAATAAPNSEPSTAAGTTPVSLSGVTHQVVVGDNGTLTFNPPNLVAAPSDTVIFTFKSKNHTVTQSTFANPCLKLNNATSGQVGFDSGFMPVEAGSSDFPTYTVTVNDTAPIWIYCKQKTPVSHCGTGMVFAINSNEQPGSTKTYADFAALAIQQNGTASNSTTGSTAGSSTTPGTSSAIHPSLSIVGTLGTLFVASSLMALL